MSLGFAMWISLLVATWGMKRFSTWIVPRDEVEAQMGGLNTIFAETFFGLGDGLLLMEGIGGALYFGLLWNTLGRQKEDRAL
jgi:hypothetical protein